MAIFVYKLTADNGGAPCLFDNDLSLAICKPIVRKCAEPGDMIFGFAADSLARQGYEENCLIYAARVSEVIAGKDYYQDGSAYAQRPDCIYRFNSTNGSYSLKAGARYHSSGTELSHDLGLSPQYDRSRVLISSKGNYRYFGKTGCRISSELPALKQLLRELTQGHRRNLSEADIEELSVLETQAWKKSGLRHIMNGIGESEFSQCECDYGVGCNKTLEDPDCGR